MRCSNCGAENNQGSHFCESCGVPLTKPQARHQVYLDSLLRSFGNIYVFGLRVHPIIVMAVIVPLTCVCLVCSAVGALRQATNPPTPIVQAPQIGTATFIPSILPTQPPSRTTTLALATATAGKSPTTSAESA